MKILRLELVTALYLHFTFIFHCWYRIFNFQLHTTDFLFLVFMSIITLRVYGILINEKNQVLVSDEYIRGGYFTKFPGGGLEFGEGTRDCLKREFIEEMGLRIEVDEHLYTTDIFMPS